MEISPDIFKKNLSIRIEILLEFFRLKLHTFGIFCPFLSLSRALSLSLALLFMSVPLSLLHIVYTSDDLNLHEQCTCSNKPTSIPLIF
jgi:hypothetical protein